MTNAMQGLAWTGRVRSPESGWGRSSWRGEGVWTGEILDKRLSGDTWARFGEISTLVGGGNSGKEQFVQDFPGKLVLKTHISLDPEILPVGISPPEIITDTHKVKLQRDSLTA